VSGGAPVPLSTRPIWAPFTVYGGLKSLPHKIFEFRRSTVQTLVDFFAVIKSLVLAAYYLGVVPL